jgi:DNA mismatch repair protein MutL
LLETFSMGIIRQLPPAVINQIAAGEVVERASSVVKELLENAIDAKATRIDLSVERGGKDLVRVADNGVGMAEDDLLLAFQPHATSKLVDADDLYRVRTLGFRGEALAAIAEVAKVRCQTRQASADHGCELTIEGGVFGPLKQCGGPVGTAIEVRNLFHNIPVRRTFLKSDMTEAGHVAEMFCRVALAHPEVHLTYRSGGKLIHDLPPVPGTRERIAVFFGRELAESLLWIEGRLDDLSLWGYVAHPSQSRSTAKGQFLFLGGRYVRDRALGHALNEAYRGLLMVGRMPVAFLHLEIPPDQVDVNVHPTKVEVRFRDPQRVYSHLLSTLRQTFLKSDLHARLQATQEPAIAENTRGTPLEEGQAQSARPTLGRLFATASGSSLGALDSGGAVDRQRVASWFEAPPATSRIPDSVGQPAPRAWAQSLPLGGAGTGGSFDEFSPAEQSVPVTSVDSAGAGDTLQSTGDSARQGPVGMVHDDREVSSRPLSGEPEAGFAAASPGDVDSRWRFGDVVEAGPKAIQVHDSYLIAETGDGMVVIDQHALHERILYEELRNRVDRGVIESQGLLIPEPVDLTAAEAALLIEQSELLGQLGLEIETFGGDTVLVRSVPAMLRHVNPGRLVRDLAEHLRTQALPPNRDGLLGELLHMIACKGAVKAGQPLSAPEIEELLARGHVAANSHHCPHGRPTALVFTKADLERQFGRT